VSGGTNPRLAAVTAAAAGAMAAGALLFALNRQIRTDSIFSIWGLVRELAPDAAFLVTGLVLRARRPGNLVGGLCLALGLLGVLSWTLTQYAAYGLVTHPGSLRGALEIQLPLQAGFAPQIALVVVLVCVFPDGRILPGRWRLVPWGSSVAFGLLFGFGMTNTPSAPFQHVHNPLHVSGRSPLLLALVVAIPLAIGSVVGAVATVVVRFRRAGRDEREQLKWLMLAAAVLPVGLTAHSIADAVAPGADGTIELIFSFAFPAFPVAIAIAVLKYRLYEIDRIISRTLVYGVLSALLAGCYAAIVLLLQTAFGSVTRGNELAVAGSTLAVAALFRPLRRRVQTVVDRRFYRSKVDAEATLAGFAARLRREADLDALLAEMFAVVGQTMSPAHVSLWLRNDVAARRNDPETVAR
jgi:hypothetical protein